MGTNIHEYILRDEKWGEDNEENISEMKLWVLDMILEGKVLWENKWKIFFRWVVGKFILDMIHSLEIFLISPQKITPYLMLKHTTFPSKHYFVASVISFDTKSKSI